MQRIAQVALLVDDYDDAIAFYVDRLGFVVKEDTPMGGAKRWVVVGPAAPGGRRGSDLLLARAINERQRSRVGDQTGGRVFLFLTTDDFAAVGWSRMGRLRCSKISTATAGTCWRLS